MQSFEIREARAGDIDEIFEIEKKSFSAPFTRDAFEYLLKGEPPFGGNVLVISGKIAGYLIYSSVISEMEILTVAVKSEFRKMGGGSLLLTKTLEEAAQKGAESAFLEVRVSNKSAQALYSKFGFKAIGMRKGYYRDNGEDAIVMKRNI